MTERALLIGLVSISDRASSGVYEDKGIPALSDWLSAVIQTPFRIETRLIADEQKTIEQTLIELTDAAGCDLVLTTGGTGPARRDVTPEATKAVATREMPGFGEQMRQISLHFVPTAILSRQTAVIRETARHAASDVKKRKHLAMRDDRGPAKHANSARSSKVHSIRSARGTPSRAGRLHG